MKYKILEANTTTMLEALVQQHFNQGWQLTGSLQLKHTPSKTTYYQAMTNANWWSYCPVVARKRKPSVQIRSFNRGLDH